MHSKNIFLTFYDRLSMMVIFRTLFYRTLFITVIKKLQSRSLIVLGLSSTRIILFTWKKEKVGEIFLSCYLGILTVSCCTNINLHLNDIDLVVSCL